jgi:hypothetical protein
MAVERGRALRRPQLRLPDPRYDAPRHRLEPAAEAGQARPPGREHGGRGRRAGHGQGPHRLERDEEINVEDIARVCEESGASAITIHGRTREQRYTKAADWALIGRVVAQRPMPGGRQRRHPHLARGARPDARVGLHVGHARARRAGQAVDLPRAARAADLAADRRGTARRLLALRRAPARALPRRRQGPPACAVLPALAPRVLPPLAAAAGERVGGARARAPAHADAR